MLMHRGQANGDGRENEGGLDAGVNFGSGQDGDVGLMTSRRLGAEQSGLFYDDVSTSFNAPDLYLEHSAFDHPMVL
jgi:hypothetical protein